MHSVAISRGLNALETSLDLAQSSKNVVGSRSTHGSQKRGLKCLGPFKTNWSEIQNNGSRSKDVPKTPDS